MRNAARVDACQQQIISALRNVGVQVYYIKLPTDLLCSGGPLKNRNLLLEVKMPGEGLNNGQQAFWDRWPGEKAVAHTVDEALSIVLGAEVLR